MNCFHFLKSFLSFLRPFPSSTFYCDYINTIKSLKAKNGTVQSQFAILYLACLYNSLHFLYLMLAPLSAAERVTHYDVLSILMAPEFNIMGPLLYGSLVYFSYRMYFTCPQGNNRLLSGILQKGNVTFFLYPITAKGTPILTSISRQMRHAFNATQSALVSFELITIGSIIYMLHIFITLVPFTNAVTFFIKFTFHTGNGILIYTTIFYYLFLISVIVPIAMVQLKIFHLKLKQILVYLNRSRFSFTQHTFSIFRRHHLDLMPRFNEYNTLYGQIFLLFLLINCPLNAVFVVTLLDPGTMPLLGQIYLVVYASLQMVAFFIMHLYLVGYSKHFHAPVKCLLSIYTETLHKVGNLQWRMQMMQTIGHFHTHRRYGVTYGHFGLVTLRSFFTFLLIYGKFLMTVYRLIRFTEK